MIILLTGAPGAGKGTQGDLLVGNNDFHKISTGDVLRRQVKEQTEIGKAAEQIMARGELVPDEVLLEIIKGELARLSDKNVILDGYPRNLNQAKSLETLPTNGVDIAIHFDVERSELLQRLSGRRVCRECGATYHVSTNPPAKAGVCDRCGGEVWQRPDDEHDKVEKRLQVYEQSTAPMLDFYRNKGILKTINGVGETTSVYQKVLESIGL